ncbi:hypothetical protein CCHOA_02175 [Corynebacterium choanae]|uniref:Uncharacterized protein n=1 Tax=Corynebacterium choanae TaxID=1862358 RepID=A0A3G6JA00_9CORY|nr:hypothetical protein CCHOA_02175 [Corynebacterium choanae]
MMLIPSNTPSWCVPYMLDTSWWMTAPAAPPPATKRSCFTPVELSVAVARGKG